MSLWVSVYSYPSSLRFTDGDVRNSPTWGMRRWEVGGGRGGGGVVGWGGGGAARHTVGIGIA